MGTHYTIVLPTKPYIAMYIQSLYGNPVIFSSENYFGMSLLGFMERKFYFRQNETYVHRAFDKLTHPLKLYFPRGWLTQSHFPYDLPTQNVIKINKLFEERFEEDLSKHCILMNLCNVDIKQAIEDFCSIHGIDIGEDDKSHITFDALKKKEYRTRKRYSENFIANLSRKKSALIRQMLF